MILSLPTEICERIARFLDWRSAICLASTCRIMWSVAMKSQVNWHRYYQTCFPPCDREGKLYLWLLSRCLDCTIFEAVKIPPTAVDWRTMFSHRYRLERNWRTGRSTRRVIELPVGPPEGLVHTTVLASSAAGCLICQTRQRLSRLFLIENRKDAQAIELSFEEIGGSSRLELYSLADRPQYVQVNDRYIVAVVVLERPSEQRMCVWRWNREDKGRMLCHWLLPDRRESLLVDIYGSWLLWTCEGLTEHNTLYANESDTTDELLRDTFYVHDLSAKDCDKPVLQLDARSGCVHIQPIKHRNPGRLDDQRITVVLVDASRPGTIHWEQWLLESARGCTTRSSVREPRIIYQDDVELAIEGNIEYLWTMRLSELDNNQIYALVVQRTAKWELVISTEERRVIWMRRAADAPGNLVMGHGLLLIDAYEPQDSKATEIKLPPMIGHVINETSSSTDQTGATTSNSTAEASSARRTQQQTQLAWISNLLNAPVPDDQQIQDPMTEDDFLQHLQQLLTASDAENGAETVTDMELQDETTEGVTGAPATQHIDVSLNMNMVGLIQHALAHGIDIDDDDIQEEIEERYIQEPPAASEQRMSIIDVRTGMTLHQYELHKKRNSIVIVGPLVLVVYWDGNAWQTYLLDVETGKPVRTLRPEEGGGNRDICASATHIPMMFYQDKIVLYDFSDFP